MTNATTKFIKLGKNIRNARKSKNLTQNELAEKLDITREHLAKIETAKRGLSLNLIFLLAEVLDIKEKELFNFDEV